MRPEDFTSDAVVADHLEKLMSTEFEVEKYETFLDLVKIYLRHPTAPIREQLWWAIMFIEDRGWEDPGIEDPDNFMPNWRPPGQRS